MEMPFVGAASATGFFGELAERRRNGPSTKDSDTYSTDVLGQFAEVRSEATKQLCIRAHSVFRFRNRAQTAMVNIEVTKQRLSGYNAFGLEHAVDRESA